MKLSEHKNLKLEIVKLPPKEKDKLLLRLIAKDKVLTEHLHFILLEDESDLKVRVEAIRSEIDQAIEETHSFKKLTAKGNLVVFRKLMKLINHNFKVTKAIEEDIQLRVYLLTKIRKTFDFKEYSRLRDYDAVFYVAFLKAVQVTLNKFDKLHEDLQFDLSESVNAMLDSFQIEDLAELADNLNIPRRV